jgi:uncharacterized protein (DUF2062 family)
MPRRLFKSLTRQRTRWQQYWFMRPFQLLLRHPAYWSLNRRSVTRAFALGLGIAFVPIPGGFLLAVALALVLRLNVPAALLGTSVTNPATVVPLYMAAYWVGCRLLDLPFHGLRFELSWEWLTTGLLPVWKPFLLGCAVLGIGAALAGYIVLGGLWHLSLVIKYHRRKEDAAGRKVTDEEG